MAKKKPAPAKSAESPAPAVEAKLSKLISFEPKQIHRREIKLAEYNPRSMEEIARHDLTKNLKHFGLVEPLVWNKRTSNLVGGHQRISIMDEAEKSDDYSLYVAVVDLDLKAEKELNIALNNPHLTGDYDLQKLGEMFKGKEVEAENTGFSPAQIYQMFGDYVLAEQPEQTLQAAEQMAQARERYEAIKEACGKRDDMDYYQIVFDSVENRIAFLEMIGARQIGIVGVGMRHDRFMNGLELKLKYDALLQRIAALEAELAASKKAS